MHNRKRSRSIAFNESEYEIALKQREALELARRDRDKELYDDIDRSLRCCFNIIKCSEDNPQQTKLLSNLLIALGPYNDTPIKLKGKYGDIVYVNLAGAAAASNKINFMKAVIECAPHTLYQHSFPIHTINMQSGALNISITKWLMHPIKASIINRNFEMLSLILDQHKFKAFSLIIMSETYKEVESFYIRKSEIELNIVNLIERTFKRTYTGDEPLYNSI